MNRIFTTRRRSGRGGRRKKSTIRSCARSDTWTSW